MAEKSLVAGEALTSVTTVFSGEAVHAGAAGTKRRPAPPAELRERTHERVQLGRVDRRRIRISHKETLHAI